MNPALEVLYFDLNISPQGVTQKTKNIRKRKQFDAQLYLLPENLNECVLKNSTII